MAQPNDDRQGVSVSMDPVVQGRAVTAPQFVSYSKEKVVASHQSAPLLSLPPYTAIPQQPAALLALLDSVGVEIGDVLRRYRSGTVDGVAGRGAAELREVGAPSVINAGAAVAARREFLKRPPPLEPEVHAGYAVSGRALRSAMQAWAVFYIVNYAPAAGGAPVPANIQAEDWARNVCGRLAEVWSGQDTWSMHGLWVRLWLYVMQSVQEEWYGEGPYNDVQVAPAGVQWWQAAAGMPVAQDAYVFQTTAGAAPNPPGIARFVAALRGEAGVLECNWVQGAALREAFAVACHQYPYQWAQDAAGMRVPAAAVQLPRLTAELHFMQTAVAEPIPAQPGVRISGDVWRSLMRALLNATGDVDGCSAGLAEAMSLGGMRYTTTPGQNVTAGLCRNEFVSAGVRMAAVHFARVWAPRAGVPGQIAHGVANALADIGRVEGPAEDVVRHGGLGLEPIDGPLHELLADPGRLAAHMVLTCRLAIASVSITSESLGMVRGLWGALPANPTRLARTLDAELTGRTRLRDGAQVPMISLRFAMTSAHFGFARLEPTWWRFMDLGAQRVAGQGLGVAAPANPNTVWTPVPLHIAADVLQRFPPFYAAFGTGAHLRDGAEVLANVARVAGRLDLPVPAETTAPGANETAVPYVVARVIAGGVNVAPIYKLNGVLTRVAGGALAVGALPNMAAQPQQVTLGQFPMLNALLHEYPISYSFNVAWPAAVTTIRNAYEPGAGRGIQCSPYRYGAVPAFVADQVAAYGLLQQPNMEDF